MKIQIYQFLLLKMLLMEQKIFLLNALHKIKIIVLLFMIYI